MEHNLKQTLNQRNKTIFMKILSKCCWIISSSENQELIYHSQNTVHWAGILSKETDQITVSSIKPEDRKLEIAAFAHEIERAFPNKLEPQNFQSFYLYKQASTIRSAEILEKIMIDCNLDYETTKEIVEIIILSSSKQNSNENSVILRDADILSFFKISLPNFFMQKISDKFLQEICFNEFKRLSENGKKYFLQMNLIDKRIKFYVDSILNKEENSSFC
jgi:hypothetical protein